MTSNPTDVDRVVQEARAVGKVPDLRRADLSGANLRGADLRHTDLRNANLSGADLRYAKLNSANLHNVNLRGADLYCADLSDASLHGADLSGANLHGADLSGTNLHGADLSNANLRGADLRIAHLVGANLHGANLRGANLHDTRGWDGLQITGLYRYQIQLMPTADGWSVIIGCWEGTPAQLKELIAQDEGWPESEGDQIPKNRKLLTTALAVIDAHIAEHPDTISHLKKS